MQITPLPLHASLSCMQLANIEKAMCEIHQTSISELHYDVVDGRFNTCFIFGDQMLGVFRSITRLPILAHLACFDPLYYLEPMIQNGADYIAIHYEANGNIPAIFTRIRQLGAKPVLAFRCDTDVPQDFLELCAQATRILKLCVNPGLAGQAFYPPALEHIRIMKAQLEKACFSIPIEVDGNICTSTIKACAKAGASMFTCGSSGLFTCGTTLHENITRLTQELGGMLNANYHE